MEQKKSPPKYTAEFRERGVRLLMEHRTEHPSHYAAYRAIAPKLGGSPDSLRFWRLRAERDAGERPGLSSEERDRIKELEREVRELLQADEILKNASAYFAPPLGECWHSPAGQRAELDRPFRK